jgi:hypothetical protein
MPDETPTLAEVEANNYRQALAGHRPPDGDTEQSPVAAEPDDAEAAE